MSTRRSRGPILMLIAVSQLILLSSMHHGIGCSDTDCKYDVYHMAFPPTCDRIWVRVDKWEQDFDCNGVESGRVLKFPSDNFWYSSAFGLDRRDFATEQDAKQYVERYHAFWSRPKAPWWKFWKTFADDPQDWKP